MAGDRQRRLPAVAAQRATVEGHRAQSARPPGSQPEVLRAFGWCAACGPGHDGSFARRRCASLLPRMSCRYSAGYHSAISRISRVQVQGTSR